MQYKIEEDAILITRKELLKLSNDYLLKADEHKKANKLMDVMYDCGAADAILELVSACERY